MRAWTLPALLALLAAGLAGCSDGGGDADDADDTGVGAIDATASKGGIRGVVLDAALVPIEAATVRLLNLERETVTDITGTFVFEDLDPGEYFVEAMHPLYDRAQAPSSVRAGEREPPLLKIQLTRQIVAEPYMWTQKYDGFITCSVNAAGASSEECGEGVGVPGVGRVGGNPNNRAQIDFTVDGPAARSLVVEQVWTPSTSVGAGGQGGFYTVVATEWACEPSCGGNRLASADGQSPLYIAVPGNALEGAGLTADTVISSFTWASTEESGVLLEQSFELFVTSSYHLPLPEGWSFVRGDPQPF